VRLTLAAAELGGSPSSRIKLQDVVLRKKKLLLFRDLEDRSINFFLK